MTFLQQQYEFWAGKLVEGRKALNPKEKGPSRLKRQVELLEGIVQNLSELTQINMLEQLHSGGSLENTQEEVRNYTVH